MFGDKWFIPSSHLHVRAQRCNGGSQHHLGNHCPLSRKIFWNKNDMVGLSEVTDNDENNNNNNMKMLMVVMAA